MKPERLRLDRLLANLGYGTRREITYMVKDGFVALDGKTLSVSEAEGKVTVEEGLRERVTVRGETLDPLPGFVLLMHKPTGLTCSHREEGELVYGLLPPRWRKRKPPISTVGRLDKETSGLLLLTDDGVLLHQIASPKRHVPKTYLATLARPLNGSETATFASGALLLDGEPKPLLPARLEPLSPTQARITIAEGRYHQVRRMFAAVGNHVETLHRESMGGLTLPAGLEAGSYEIVPSENIAKIFDFS